MKYSVDELVAIYGNGKSNPTRSQWERLIDGDMGKPLTTVSFFKVREIADPTTIEEAMSGREAFAKYAETSVPKISKLGGSFVLKGAVEGNFIGENLEEWHIISIVQYPRRENFLELLSDDEYNPLLSLS